MKLINPFKSFKSRQNDKFQILIRLGKVTILGASFDVSDKKWKFELFNIAITNEE